MFIVASYNSFLCLSGKLVKLLLEKNLLLMVLIQKMIVQNIWRLWDKCLGKLVKLTFLVRQVFGLFIFNILFLFSIIHVVLYFGIDTDRQFQVPDYLCCKITLDIFRDPVITPSGVTYERAVILDHLQKVTCALGILDAQAQIPFLFSFFFFLTLTLIIDFLEIRLVSLIQSRVNHSINPSLYLTWQ